MSLPFKEVHLKRWQVGAAFALLTVIFVFGLQKVRHDGASIADLRHTNASLQRTNDRLNGVVSELQKTDCGLKVFLVAARNARARAANTSTGAKAHDDELLAVHAYEVLSATFGDKAVGDSCEVPTLVKLRDPKPELPTAQR